MSFKKYLIEQAIAAKGDWTDGVNKISTTSETVINAKWNLLTTFNFSGTEVEFRKLNNSLEFILGYWTTETRETKEGIIEKPVFEAIFRMGCKRQKSLESKLGYTRLINVDGVAVLSTYTGKGISTTIYKYMVNTLGYTIMGDEVQYFGARKLWARLSNEIDVQVDIIDTNTKTKVKKNVILHHGNYDEDFDKALWSYEGDKKHLRSILIKMI